MLNLEYNELYKLSILQPEKLWDEYAKDVIWHKPYSTVLENKYSPFPRWFDGGEINMSYNCLDRQVLEGYGDDVAVIYDSPVRKIIQKLTYNELLKSVELFAGVLADKCSMKKGDKVLFFFPTIPQSLIGMLACARIGVIYTFVFGGFASKEIARRIIHFKPKIVITTTLQIDPSAYLQYKEKVDMAIQESGFHPEFCITYNMSHCVKVKINGVNDLDWDSEISKAKPQGAIPLESSHPLHVMYTSGSTGDPKPLVFSTAGAVVNYKMKLPDYLNLKPYETVLATSNFAWVLGQSTMSFGALMSRNPTIIYEGVYSERTGVLEFLRVIKEHKVSAILCIPTIFKAIIKYCNKKDLEMDFSDLKVIGIGGELHDSALDKWISNTFQVPVYDVWGQTELSGMAIGPCLGHKRSSSSNGVPIPGLCCKVVDSETSIELPKGTIGRLLLKLPLNPARAITFLNNDERFEEIYFKKYPGYYDTMDSAVLLDDNEIKIMSREDNIIHVGATRINGGSVEEACLQDQNLEHAIVVPFTDLIKGFVPFAFLIPKSSDKRSEKAIIETAIQNVLDNVGEVSSFNKAVIVKNLPKNVNGKFLRKSLEMMINGEKFKVPGTVVNPEAFQEIYDILCLNGCHPALPVDL